MKILPSNQTARGLTADVNAEVIVKEDGRLGVSLKIEADNGTSALIELTDTYRIPVSTAFSIAASDKNGELYSTYGNGILEVHFRSGTILQPGKKYWWRILFGTKGYLTPNKEGNILIGPYSIKPQESYKDLTIRNHRFTYKFVFEKPKPMKGWPFKRNYVFQVNSRQIAARQKQRLSSTEYNFEPFNLEPNEDMTIYFTRVYRFSSKLLALMAFLTSAVIAAIVHSIICLKD